jgi:hypothetical protein
MAHFGERMCGHMLPDGRNEFWVVESRKVDDNTEVPSDLGIAGVEFFNLKEELGSQLVIAHFGLVRYGECEKLWRGRQRGLAEDAIEADT